MRGATFQKAVLASIGVHLLLVGFALVLLQWHPSETGTALVASIETRADVRFEFTPEETSPATELSPPTQVSATPPSEPKPPANEVSGPPLVQAVAMPRTLPAEVMVLVKKNSAASTSVAEIPMSSSLVEPSSAKAISPSSEPKWAAGRPALHGALGSKQSIVYVLDASGSMGEWGKFDAARGALIATLRLQPETVRFQVVVYAGTASLPIRGACLPATPGNIAKAIEALQALAAPSGRSNHTEGVRSALTFRPDVVLILTDADDLPTTQLRGVVREAEHSAKLCVATVSGRGVAAPVEVK